MTCIELANAIETFAFARFFEALTPQGQDMILQSVAACGL